MTRPDSVVTEMCPEPRPSVPFTDRVAGPFALRRQSNWLRTRPEVERRLTLAFGSAGSRRATSDDTVATRTCPGLPRCTSAVTLPLTVLAFSRSSAPPARVRSPDTELNETWPFTSWASTSPDTVRASTRPPSPSSVIAPETLRTEVRAATPDTTAVAPTTPTWAGQSRGTVTVMSAECSCGRSHSSSPSQVRSS